jgi:hypothetical protein
MRLVQIANSGWLVRAQASCGDNNIITQVGDQFFHTDTPKTMCVAWSREGVWRVNDELLRIGDDGLEVKEVVGSLRNNCPEPVISFSAKALKGFVLRPPFIIPTEVTRHLKVFDLDTGATLQIVATSSETHDWSEYGTAALTVGPAYRAVWVLPPHNTRRKRGIFKDAFNFVSTPFRELAVAVGDSVAAVFEGVFRWAKEKCIRFYDVVIVPWFGSLHKRYNFIVVCILMGGLVFLQPSVLLTSQYWIVFSFLVLWVLSGGLHAEALDPRNLDMDERGVFYLIDVLVLIYKMTSFNALVVVITIFLIPFFHPNLLLFGKKFLFQKIFLFFVIFLENPLFIVSLSVASVLFTSTKCCEIAWVRFQFVLADAEDYLVSLNPWPRRWLMKISHHASSWPGDVVSLAHGRLGRLGKILPLRSPGKGVAVHYPYRVRHLLGSVFFRGEEELLTPLERLKLDLLNPVQMAVFIDWSVPVCGREKGDLSWLPEALHRAGGYQ